MSLELIGLSKRFGAVVAVDDVHLSVAQGETLALLGPSGCGKSTLLRLIAGLERPDAGRLELGGRDVTRVPPRLRDIGMVFQAYALFPHLGVADNVAFGLVEAGVAREERERRVAELLEVVGLSGLEKRRVDALSGGQQQRVALARALARDPAMLLLDEPLSNLDERLRQTLKGELARLLGSLGKRAIYVTHDQAEAFTLADRVALMREGRIVQVGEAEELLRRPISGWAARFLGHENVYPQGAARALPVAGGAGEVLFRADLARLEAPGAGGGSSGGGSSSDPGGDAGGGGGGSTGGSGGETVTEAVVVQAAREGLSWLLTLEARGWGVEVAWRGFDRELPATPEVGQRLRLVAPARAWSVLPGEAAEGQAPRAEKERE